PPEWLSGLRHCITSLFNMEHFSGMHNWYACSHARPTFCNVCREALSGVTSHGLSCEVCKFKAHKRCAVRSTNTCKWTTLASIGNDIMEDNDGTSLYRQFLRRHGSVFVLICTVTCGTLYRQVCAFLNHVHSSCKEQMGKVCPLGQCRVSIIPPTVLNSINSDGFWKATSPSCTSPSWSSPSCTSPLLVLCNSKSGDNQGVKFLRKFKQLLNPAQVFDLMNGGPQLGLRVFQKFATFRILVCGGDGSVGWVLSALDKLNLHKQCQLGVLPLGTGNDLARVLGWGALCDDDTQLLQILEKLERATTKMLDRWSVMTYELPTKHCPMVKEDYFSPDSPLQYADSVASHLTKILDSDKHTDVISSAKYVFLCGTVNDFVAEVGRAYEKATENKEEADAMAKKVCVCVNVCVLCNRLYNTSSQWAGERESISQSINVFIIKDMTVAVMYLQVTIVSLFIFQTITIHGYLLKGNILWMLMIVVCVCVLLSSQCSEKCVLNNYFGIGLDAKISLEFNNKRDEHPKKCRYCLHAHEHISIQVEM
uniref:diacylglycerol kinase (ATP) n=1 Tax=Hucho hucho TaxID=62062 RepID=A0A4W5KHP0_9TELE